MCAGGASYTRTTASGTASWVHCYPSYGNTGPVLKVPLSDQPRDAALLEQQRATWSRGRQRRQKRCRGGDRARGRLSHYVEPRTTDQLHLPRTTTTTRNNFNAMVTRARERMRDGWVREVLSHYVEPRTASQLLPPTITFHASPPPGTFLTRCGHEPRPTSFNFPPSTHRHSSDTLCCSEQRKDTGR